MSEYDSFHQRASETEDEMSSLLRGIDFQICLMRLAKSQIESCIRNEERNASEMQMISERGSRYGKSGYMADVELDDRGRIASISYDWVEP